MSEAINDFYGPNPGSNSGLIDKDFVALPDGDYGKDVVEPTATENWMQESSGEIEPSYLELDAITAPIGALAGALGLKRAGAIRHNKDVQKLYEEGLSKIKIKHSNPDLSKIENFKQLGLNTDYKKERSEFVEEVKKYFKNEDGNKEQWLGESNEIKNLYHGTNKDIKSFDPSKTDYSVHNVEGTYTTINPTDAEQYTDGRGGNILPLIGKDSGIVDTQTSTISIEDVKKFGLPEYKLHELKNSTGRYNIGAVLRASQKSYKENTEIMRSLGATGLRDGGHYIFFNPNDLKSKYNKGDYSLDDNDLANSFIGLGVGAGVASQQNEKEN